MKRLIITTLKITLSVAIIGYLVWDATREKGGGSVFHTLVEQPKRWDLLAGAWAVSVIGVLLTLVRWYYLVRAVGISFSIRDALRIGFLGYLFNLAPMGIVGGDLLKAVMLGREHPGCRARAVASVILDRLIGLYALFVVASAGILLTGFWRLPILQWHLIIDFNLCQVVLVLTAIGTAGIGLLLVPAVTGGRWVADLARLPRIGTAIHSLVDAMRIYRSNLPVLLAAMVMSVGVHCSFTISIYLVARGLPGDVLPLSTQFVVYPISSVASTLPLPAGPFEAVLEFLYTHVPGSPIPKGQGLVVALVFRLMAILLALVGFCYYMGSRREVAEVMHEAETEEAAGDSVWADAALEPGAGPGR